MYLVLATVFFVIGFATAWWVRLQVNRNLIRQLMDANYILLDVADNHNHKINYGLIRSIYRYGRDRGYQEKDREYQMIQSAYDNGKQEQIKAIDSGITQAIKVFVNGLETTDKAAKQHYDALNKLWQLAKKSPLDNNDLNSDEPPQVLFLSEGE